MGRRKGSKDKEPGIAASKRHSFKCSICHHAKRLDIEMDYTHWIPWKEITKRYGVNAWSIGAHARSRKLDKERDRRHFYEYMMSNFNAGKISAENAIEASKQLDRIDRVIQDNPVPTNIVVNYSWGKALEDKREEAVVGELPVTDRDRLPAPPDSGEVPPQQEDV